MNVHQWHKPTLIVVVLLVGFYPMSKANYLLFHSLAESFSIVIAASIFMLIWNARRHLKNNFLLFIGVASLFVAIIDLIHMLAYKGMGVFPGVEANLATQTWIAARYLQSISFFIAPFFIRRRLQLESLFFVYIIGVTLLLSSIFYLPVFPTCFVEGVGLTPFKKISEYIISLILGGAAFLLYRKRQEFDQRTMGLILTAYLFTIFSELAFTFYVDLYDLFNMMGHYFKIIAFFLIYLAIIEIGLMEPYNLLFRKLQKKQEELQFAHYALENVSDCALWINKSGRITYANKAVAQMLDYPQEELLSFHISDLNPKFTPSLLKKQWQQLKKVKGILLESILVGRNGRLVEVETSANYVNFEGNEFNCLFFRDISSRKMAENESHEAVGRLEEFNKIMVEREMRSIELKKEINQLCDELGRVPVYPFTEETPVSDSRSKETH